MNSRDRVKMALNFEEPDRVPMDLGGTTTSGIMAHALDRLRDSLELEKRPVKVNEVLQMLGEVEMDVIDKLEVDILPVEPLVQFFGLKRERYKPWKLFDGTDVSVPGDFDVEVDDNGDFLLHREGDISQPVEGKMPKRGYYFDVPAWTESNLDFHPPKLEDVARDFYQLKQEELDFLARRARQLRQQTDKALVLCRWGAVGLPAVGSIPDFLCLLATDREYIKDLFELETTMSVTNLQKLWGSLGDDLDIIALEGYDFGSQRSELFSPEWFEELYVPFFKKQNHWIHTHTTWKSWLHSCGSITRILPMLIESGLDIINPVQCSAAGMEPIWLKENFGDKIVFWGGGVDTQKTFPFGTPAEVRDEVTKRIEIFAPGGGYIFNPVHNIQYGTPAENIIVAYQTAKTVGTYPIKD